MTVTQRIITIAVIVLGTMLTRFLPFLLFPAGKPTPKYIQYLGKVLPAAAFGMLVIYCLKDVPILSGNHGLPELISIVLVVLLHLWKRQMLLSIAGGTICYMLLVQLVFINPTATADALLIGRDLGEQYISASIDMDTTYTDVDSNHQHFENQTASDIPIDEDELFTLELPDGYTLSKYTTVIATGGGKLIEPQSYEILGDSSGTPIEWTMSGCIAKIPDAQIFFTFKDGQIDGVSVIANHTLQETIETLNGLDMPAVLCSVSHDLYTLGDLATLDEQGISEPKITSSDYWYIFFAREDADEGFYLALDQKQFSKDAAIKIAETVKFNPRYLHFTE